MKRNRLLTLALAIIIVGAVAAAGAAARVPRRFRAAAE